MPELNTIGAYTQQEAASVSLAASLELPRSAAYSVKLPTSYLDVRTRRSAASDVSVNMIEVSSVPNHDV